MRTEQETWKRNYASHSTRFLLEINNDNLLPEAKRILECELVERGLKPPFKLDRSLPLRDSEVKVLESMAAHGGDTFKFLDETAPKGRAPNHEGHGGVRGVSDIKDNEFLNLPTEQLKAIRRDTSLQVMRDLIDSILVERENAQRDKKYSSKKNIFLKAFCGELPLWATFWIFGVFFLLSMIWVTNFIFIDPSQGFWLDFIIRYGITSFKIVLLAISCFILFYRIAIIIGIWKSSNKYTGPKLWAILAKAFMLLWMWGTVPQVAEIVEVISSNGDNATDSSISRNGLEFYRDMVRNLLN